MSFERTIDSSKESVEETDDKETLKEEEDTSSSTGEDEENDTESEEDTSTNESEESEEESVEELKARLAKVEQDRDNYRNGMIAAKTKKRSEATMTESNVTKEVNEEAVEKVLSKRTEKEALRNTITPSAKDYIPELVDDNQYQEIIQYLPRNLDRMSYDSIVRGLKIATKMWKEERGIEDKPIKKNLSLHTIKSDTVSGNQQTAKKKGRTILKGQVGAASWYN